MKIEEIRIDIIESESIEPAWRPHRHMMEYPGSYRARFGHRPWQGEPVRLEPRPAYGAVLRLRTDSNLETCGLLNVSWGKDHVEWEAHAFKAQWGPEIIGENALDRERMWHKLWMARRYFHVPSTAPIELIDILFWDLGGQMANMPVHKLIGGFRDRIRAYQVVTSLSYEENLKAAAKAKDDGFFGFKDHMMLGVETNLSLARDLRDLVGDEFELMHDPVQQYTVDEAIYVGKALQDLGYLWIEEPLQEVDIRGLKEISRRAGASRPGAGVDRGPPLPGSSLPRGRRGRHRPPTGPWHNRPDQTGESMRYVRRGVPRRQSARGCRHAER